MAASEEMYDTNIYRYHFTCPHTLDTYIKIVLDVPLTMWQSTSYEEINYVHIILLF